MILYIVHSVYTHRLVYELHSTPFKQTNTIHLYLFQLKFRVRSRSITTIEEEETVSTNLQIIASNSLTNTAESRRLAEHRLNR